MKFKILGVFLFLSLFFGGCSEKKIELEIQDEKNYRLQESQIVEENFQTSFEGKTIQDLLNQDSALECSWKIEKAEISSDADVENVDEEASGGIEEGWVYFKEGQFFQEVQITENSRKTVIKTLKNGDWFYQWNSLVTSQGMKMFFEKAKGSDFLKINKIYNWNCQEFSGSEDIFRIPGGVKFLNF